MLVGKGNIAWEDQEGDTRKMVRLRSFCRVTFTRNWNGCWCMVGYWLTIRIQAGQSSSRRTDSCNGRNVSRNFL